MKKRLLSTLFSVIILAATTMPAEARIVVGLSPENSIAASTELTNILSQKAGDKVQLRSFDDNTILISWLLRFQEIDAAIVSQNFIKQQPAGTLRSLADLYKENAPTPSVVVVRSNLSSDKATALQKALLDLASTDSGRRALAKAKISGFTLPGKALKRKVVKAKPAAEKPVQKAPLPALAAPAKDQPETSATPAVVSIKQKTKVPPTAPQAEKPVAVQSTQKAQPKATPPVEKKELSASGKKPSKVEEKPVPPEEKPAALVKKEEHKTSAVTQKPGLVEQPKQQKKAVEKPSSSKRLILFIALVILVAILLKLSLLFMRWRSKSKRTLKPTPPPPFEPPTEQEEVLAEVPEEEPQESEPLVIETGYIGPGKVPALLKRCADLPEPVVLQVTKGSCEKLIYFAGGQVSGAMTQNATVKDSGIRWNKLGNMLLREEFITPEERDQALALLTREPHLRFGEGLLKLGYITLAELRHALTRQAKITIYSLILFPEGQYKVYSEEGSLPPEESVALEVTNLIREASHHQSEWMAIRQALPNLNTALDFTAEGRKKLEQVNLSPQQEEMLTHIDGKRTINELGIESTMMDYEVYRFLYLMVKAGVLQ